MDNPIHALTLFGILTAVFHLPVLWVLLKCPDRMPVDKNLWKRRWKTTDYLWLGLGGLGLLTATDEVARLVADVELKGALHYEGYAGTLELAQTMSRISPNIQSSSPPTFAWFQDTLDLLPKGDAHRDAAREQISQGDRDNAKQNLEAAASAYKTFLDKHRKPEETVYPDDASAIRKAIQDRADNIERLQSLLMRTERGETANILAFLSPVLLAFGLSIRIAKVSAELLVER
jgi:hypothetical protein